MVPSLTHSLTPSPSLAERSPLALRSTYTLINSAGAGSLSPADTFIYTAALSTVAPTGNVTLQPTGTEAGRVSNLQPDPTNLQVSPFGGSGGGQSTWGELTMQ